MIFIIAQAALAKWHASRRSANATVEDRAARCNRNAVTNSLSITSQTSSAEAQAKT